MKLKYIGLLLIFNAMNYLLIPIAVFVSNLSADRVNHIVYLLFFLLHIGLSIVNTFIAKTFFLYIILSIDLFLATLISYPLWAMLSYAKGDNVSTMIITLAPYITAFGCIISIGCSVGAYFLNRKRIPAKKSGTVKSNVVSCCIAVLVLFLVVGILVSMMIPTPLNVTDSKEATLRFSLYGNVSQEDRALSREDRQTIVKLLDGKNLYVGMPYGIFTKSNSITIGDQLFIFCWGSSSVIIQYNTRYLYLNSEETTKFTNVLKHYGATIPPDVEIISG